MDILDTLKSLAPCQCCLERVGGYMPGDSAPSSVKFGRHMGHLEMGLLAANIPVILNPTPAKWQAFFIGKQSYTKIPKSTPDKVRKQILAKRKTERKNKIKAKAQAQFPHLRVTLKNSDALGLLQYMLEYVGGKEK